MKRRELLKGGLVLVASTALATILRPVGAAARVFTGGEKWQSSPTFVPKAVDPAKRVFFTQQEADLVKAVFDRLIPSDELSISASEAGCVTFTDYQMISAYGSAEKRYKLGPVIKGTPEQGEQSITPPSEIYRKGLKALQFHCQKEHGKSFEGLTDAEKDQYLENMEAGKFDYGEIDSGSFFALMLSNVKEGFLADPLYGGNKDMVGWKMVGFPGARYDYRDYVKIKGKKIELEPVSLLGRFG